jgi:hypothetical protein
LADLKDGTLAVEIGYRACLDSVPGRNSGREGMRKQEGGARLYRAQFRRLLELDERIRSGSYPNAFSFARE